jgi:flagellar basal body P-ring protein FlgI
MNSMGMKPADLVGVMQALQSAGALQGELRFM